MDSRSQVQLSIIERRLESKRMYLETLRKNSASYRLTEYDIELLVRKAKIINEKWEDKCERKREKNAEFGLATQKLIEAIGAIETLDKEKAMIIENIAYKSVDEIEKDVARLKEIKLLRDSVVKSRVQLQRHLDKVTYVRDPNKTLAAKKLKQEFAEPVRSFDDLNLAQQNLIASVFTTPEQKPEVVVLTPDKHFERKDDLPDAVNIDWVKLMTGE